jgi:drug/metabolite transporter (DMT)-like permease
MSILINGFINFRGEFFALSGAFLWAVSSILFKIVGKIIRPVELNLIKGIVGFLLLGVTSLILGEHFLALGWMPILALLISGAVGIGFGDTMFFEAINRLGASRALLISILAPPLAAIFGWIFLHETLSLYAWLGILVTILGVTWVVTEENRDKTDQTAHLNGLGLFFGFLAALTQAIGAILSRWALSDFSISPLQSAIIRLFAGTIFMVFWAILRREKIGQWIQLKPPVKVWSILTISVILGSYIDIWLQQLAFKFASVGIASTLLATSPLFALPIAAVQKEKISTRSLVGVILALVGIGLIFLAG